MLGKSTLQILSKARVEFTRMANALEYVDVPHQANSQPFRHKPFLAFARACVENLVNPKQAKLAGLTGGRSGGIRTHDP